MDYRKTFDQIPETFDKWRPRYCPALFAYISRACSLNAGKRILEIGPGTGQATEPFLKIGYDYTAIELGEHLAAYTQNKFRAYPNFHLIQGDFEVYDFGAQKFDLIVSAATIQWIREDVAFSKTFRLLKPGGALAMFMTETDLKTPNKPLYDAIQAVYRQYFHPQNPYTCRITYEHALNYGFSGIAYRQWQQTRTMGPDEYTAYISTHTDHINLPEPDKTLFYNGIQAAIRAAGGKMVLNDTIKLYLAKKPA